MHLQQESHAVLNFLHGILRYYTLPYASDS